MRATRALFTDADNTLWDTDAVFARAQHLLLAAVRQHLNMPAGRSDDQALAFLRRVDQHIAVQHPAGLRYPPLLLAAGLRRALRGDDAGSLDLATLLKDETSDLTNLIDEYVATLSEPPELREGVAEGLRIVSETGSLVTVVTEGAKLRCLDMLGHHGLAKFVSDCVSIQKSVEAYRSLARGVGRPLMVGDQLDRDILFAASAGLRTCYFAGRFAPFWSRSVVANPDFEIRTYLDVPALLNAPPTARARRKRA